MTSLETVTLVTAITGAVCGTVGAALGIINAWAQWSRSRVRLRVVPKMAFMVNGGAITCDRYSDDVEGAVIHGKPARFCIEVANLSAFPVTIHDVGFGQAKGEGVRHCLVPVETSPDRPWPVRLEPREAVTAYGEIGQLGLRPEIVKSGKAYAKTDCGQVRYGTSRIFRQYVREVIRRERKGGDHG